MQRVFPYEGFESSEDQAGDGISPGLFNSPGNAFVGIHAQVSDPVHLILRGAVTRAALEPVTPLKGRRRQGLFDDVTADILNNHLFLRFFRRLRLLLETAYLKLVDGSMKSKDFVAQGIRLRGVPRGVIDRLPKNEGSIRGGLAKDW